MKKFGFFRTLVHNSSFNKVATATNRIGTDMPKSKYKLARKQ
jgi:hypothetical protein